MAERVIVLDNGADRLGRYSGEYFFRKACLHALGWIFRRFITRPPCCANISRNSRESNNAEDLFKSLPVYPGGRRCQIEMYNPLAI